MHSGVAMGMGVNQSLDERRVPAYGRAPCRRVMPKKPIQVGWTLFAAACAVTSYLWNFFWDDSFTVNAEQHRVTMAEREQEGKPTWNVGFIQSIQLTL